MNDSHAVKTVTQMQFESLLAENEIVFIDFWAEWCAPCKQFAAIYERIAKQHDNCLFGKVNIEQEAELAETFQIRSIPHLIIFKQGLAIYSEAGSMPESTLKELVQQALAVDVSQVKAQLQQGEQ